MKISLKAKFRKSSTGCGRLAYGLTVSVEEAVGIPAEVFLYRREGPVLSSDRLNGESFWFFQNVCSPVDIIETPARGSEDGVAPFVRFSTCELMFRSQDDMDRAESEISGDLASLARTWENVTDESKYEHEETREYTNE